MRLPSCAVGVAGAPRLRDGSTLGAASTRRTRRYSALLRRSDHAATRVENRCFGECLYDKYCNRQCAAYHWANGPISFEGRNWFQ